MKIKEFDGSTYIDVQEIELFPWEGATLDEKPSLKILNKETALRGVSNNSSAVARAIIGTGVRGGLITMALFINPFVALLARSKAIFDIVSFIGHNDKEAILLKFTGQVQFKQMLADVFDLEQKGEIEGAIKILSQWDIKFEKIDDTSIRTELNIQKARLKAQNGHYLGAAIDYIVAATLSSSMDTMMERGEKQGQVVHMSRKGQLYLASVLMLRQYIHLHGANLDILGILKEFAEKSMSFLEHEAKYREKLGIHNVGFWTVKNIKIPKVSFGKDTDSAAINRVVASNVEKLISQIEDIYDPNKVFKILKSRDYESYSSEMDLIDLLENVELATNKSHELDKDIKKDIHHFFSHVCACFEDDPTRLLMVRITEAKLSSKWQEYNKTALICQNILEIIKKNPMIQGEAIVQVEQVRSMLPKDKANELASQTAAILPERSFSRVFFEKTSGKMNEDIQHVVLDSFYPNNEEEFSTSLIQIPCGDYYFRQGKQIFKADAKAFRALLVERFYKRSGELPHIVSRVDLSELSHPHYECVKQREKTNSISIGLEEPLEIKINKICEAFSKEPSFISLKERCSSKEINIGVFGAISTGKSSFLNALLGKNLLGIDKDIATNVKTKIYSSITEEATVHFIGGETKSISHSDITLYTTEQHNPKNEKSVDYVRVGVPTRNLQAGLCFEDIPGLGSYEAEHQFHRDCIDAEVDRVDCAILITCPTDGLKEYELQLIKYASQEKKIPFLLVVNKIDNCESDDLLDIQESMEKKMLKEGIDVKSLGIRFLSAKMGLAAIHKDKDVLRSYGIDAQTALEASKLSQCEEHIYEKLVPQVLNLRTVSLRERAIFELDSYENDLKLLQKQSLMALNHEKDSLREKLFAIEKLMNELASPADYESKTKDMLDRFNIFDPDILIHKSGLDAKDISRLGGVEKATEVIRQKLMSCYAELRDEKILRYYNHVMETLQMDIDLLSSEVFINTKETVENLKGNIVHFNSEYLNWTKKLDLVLKKERFVFDLARQIISEIISTDHYTLSRKLHKELSLYTNLHSRIVKRRDSLLSTIEMNEGELKHQLQQLDKTLTTILESRYSIKGSL